MPRRQPFARRWRASARVSTPAIAGMVASRSRAASCRASSRTAAVAFATTSARSHGRIGLVVGDEAPVVADEGIGHDHDLAGVRGVRADLLVAGLTRIHDEVATGADRCPERDAGKDGAVLEGQEGRPEVPDARVDDRARARRRWDDQPALTGARIRRTHRPRWLGGQGRARTSVPPSPASLDRYAGLTGPAMQGHRQGSIPPGPTARPADGRRVRRARAGSPLRPGSPARRGHRTTSGMRSPRRRAARP